MLFHISKKKVWSNVVLLVDVLVADLRKYMFKSCKSTTRAIFIHNSNKKVESIVVLLVDVLVAALRKYMFKSCKATIRPILIHNSKKKVWSIVVPLVDVLVAALRIYVLNSYKSTTRAIFIHNSRKKVWSIVFLVDVLVDDIWFFVKLLTWKQRTRYFWHNKSQDLSMAALPTTASFPPSWPGCWYRAITGRSWEMKSLKLVINKNPSHDNPNSHSFKRYC